MLPKDIIEDVCKRLRFIKGQLGGIEKMLNNGKEPKEIINQFKAAEEALNKAHFSFTGRCLSQRFGAAIVSRDKGLSR